MTPVTPDEMHAAQILTGATMASWIAVGLIPGLRPHAGRIRLAVLAAYLLGCAGFIVWFLLLR